MLTRTLILSAFVSLAAAQLPISSACQTALTTIGTSADVNECLVPAPLVPILTNPDASVVDPVNSWLTGLCAAPACSNTTLAAIVTNVTTGCSAELETFGFSGSDDPTIIALVQKYYPTVRKAACLKDGNTNCITQTLTNAQNVLGTLSPDNVFSLVSAGGITSLPPNVTCTDCIKAIYNTVNTDIPGLLDSQGAQDTCGASFTDGTTPAGITQSASDVAQPNTTTSTKNGNGAAQLSFGALSGASIIAALALVV